MDIERDIARLTRHVHGALTGEHDEIDEIDSREVSALRRVPLQVILLMLEAGRRKIRGARGNTPRDVIDLLDQVRRQLSVSKLELARRSGVSRGHITDMIKSSDPRPTLETVVRLAVGLDYALEVISIESDDDYDDAEIPASDADAEDAVEEEREARPQVPRYTPSTPERYASPTRTWLRTTGVIAGGATTAGFLGYLIYRIRRARKKGTKS
ncbi:MAG: helix-turn-helix transcriptional regulator [Myxococcales bacterium]|nr:helix-turn-helix transcriptional regulator [Myxococcales bacterium]